MGIRRIVPVLLLLLVAGAAAQVADPESVPKPERQTTCWDCHQVVQGDSGPLVTFVNLIPPETRGAAPGQAFDYPVQAQNAWSQKILSLRVTLDLSNAPAVGFASDVDAIDALVADAIPVDTAAPTAAQTRSVTVFVPDGETRMDVRLRPQNGDPVTGPDLALHVYPPTFPLDGEPYVTVDAPDPGGEEVFTVANRTGFNQLGYGNWTFVAEGRLVPDPAAGNGVSLPSAQGDIPFEVEVHAVAEATEDRVASLLTTVLVPKGGSATLPFRLFAIRPPGPGETVTMSADLWVHYDHVNDANDDHENATKVDPRAILVVDERGATTLRTELGPATTVARMPNGATMSTVSEAVGYATAFLLVSSVWTGGIFGKASRRGLNAVFGAAKRRVAFHNFLSYGILLAATAHTALFLVEAAYNWTLGIIWGGIAVLALLGLGVTGALQVAFIRRLGYSGWRWTHYGLAVAAILFTVVHVLLDGVHFADVQNALGWKDPLDPRAGAQ